MSYILTALILVRLVWAVWPQNGYIHPDEFFQTVEVVAGDALNISVERTWEYTSSYPLRSVALPQLLFSPVFKLLRYADENSSFSMTGYHLIASYRFLMTILSLWIDMCIYKICRIMGVQGHIANILYASSYVTLTFQTHAFSNSFETILFVTLMWLILVCMKKDEENSRKRCGKKVLSEMDKMMDIFSDMSVYDTKDANEDSDDLDSSFNDLHKMAFDIRKRNREFNSKITSGRVELPDIMERKKSLAKKDKNVSDETQKVKSLQKLVTQSSGQTSVYIDIAVLAVIVTAGIFNRPTYIIFTLLPLLWWIDKYPVGESNVIKRLLVFSCTGLVFAVIFIAIDTVYFTDVEMPSFFTVNGLRSLLDNAVISPLNFLMYNSMASNLKTHGHHPFYLHFLINLPLLFGPVILYVWKHIVSAGITTIKDFRKGKDSDKNKKKIADMNISIEEKIKGDLKEAIYIFILVPVIVLSVFPHQEARFLIPISPLLAIGVILFNKKIGKLFWISFVIFNILLSIVFGFLHQGGVIPCLLKLQQLTENELKMKNTSVTVIFSHTYMPPKHLLISRTKHLEVLDLKGSDFQKVFDELEKHRDLDTTPNDSFLNFSTKKVFVVLPGTLVTEFKLKFNKVLAFKSEEKFFPHLSFEDPPDMKFIGSLEVLADRLSLYLVEIE